MNLDGGENEPRYFQNLGLAFAERETKCDVAEAKLQLEQNTEPIDISGTYRP